MLVYMHVLKLRYGGEQLAGASTEAENQQKLVSIGRVVNKKLVNKSNRPVSIYYSVISIGPGPVSYEINIIVDQYIPFLYDFVMQTNILFFSTLQLKCYQLGTIRNTE